MTAQPWEPRIARLEGAYEQVDRRLGAIDARLETLGTKIDGVREELSRRLEGFEGRFDRLQWRLTSLIVGTWITTMLAIFLHKP